MSINERAHVAVDRWLDFLVFFSIAVLVLAALMFFVSCGGSSGGSTTSSDPPPPPDAVFMGDSLTVAWDLKTYFPGKNYANKGKSGDTSADMLARFQTDVIALKPKIVMLWAGGNDVPANVAVSVTVANLTSMRNQAVAAGIKVVLCNVPPERDTGVVFNPTIVDLNNQIASLAAGTGTTLADYYTAVVDPATGELRADYAVDNHHLNAAGYNAITPVAATAIANAK